MRRRKCSEERAIGILKEHGAGLSEAGICRKNGISDATFRKWRSRYRRMEVPDARAK